MSDRSLDIRRQVFQAAPCTASLGIELESVGSGERRTRLELRPDHRRAPA